MSYFYVRGKIKLIKHQRSYVNIIKRNLISNSWVGQCEVYHIPLQWKFLIEVSKRKQKSVFLATVYSLGERNGKDVGMKSKPAPIGVKVIEKETRKIQEQQMITHRIHNCIKTSFI